MPNRIIKESICTSEDVARLSQGAEILFYRLIVKADDFGAYYGNEAIIRSTCFPLKADTIKCRQVEAWLEELSDAGLIIRYSADDGRKYIQFAKWDIHQQIRAKKRKFPPFDDTCQQLIANDINCNQMISNDSNCSRNPIQSNPNPIRIESEKGFRAPDLEEVKVFCFENGLECDPEEFFDYYSANGWKVGKSAMKDWKAAARNWARRDKEFGKKPKPKADTTRKDDSDRLMRMLQ